MDLLVIKITYKYIRFYLYFTFLFSIFAETKNKIYNMEEKSGIYMFTYKDKWAYVGQSINIDNRIKQHKRDIYLKRQLNLSIFDDYSINDIKFKILEYCDIDSLNEKEYLYEKKISEKYKMLNIKQCGIQKNMNEHIFFYDDKINIKYDGTNFYINKWKIKSKGRFHSLISLSNYIKENTNYTDFRFTDKINKLFIDRICALHNIEYNKDISYINFLKSKGYYITIGRGLNRETYCDFDCFITFLYMSCPRLSASLIMALYDNNIINKYHEKIMV